MTLGSGWPQLEGSQCVAPLQRGPQENLGMTAKGRQYHSLGPEFGRASENDIKTQEH